MDTTMFLAQAFGLYLAIAGVAMLLNPKLINGLVKTLAGSHAAIAAGGFLSLILGIPLILIHNIWDGDMVTTIVTVLAWATFLKGITRIMMPGMVMGWSESFMQNQGLLKGMLVVMTLVGLYLCYVGFGFGM